MARSRKQLTLFDDYQSMLADSVRMDAYARAIDRTIQPGDRVLDLGAGLGILGFLALKAGAAHVYAVEMSDAIDLAKAVAERNGLSDRVTFLRANSKDVTAEDLGGRVDVLLSETLGSFGVEENTLDFTIDARDRLLVPGGRMIPEGLTLYCAPARHPDGSDRLSFWSDVRGLDFSPAVDELLGRMALADIGPRQLLADPQVHAAIDLSTVTSPEVAARLLFRFPRKGTVDGVAGWFEARLAEGASVGNGPRGPKTHWRQAFFPLRERVDVVTGDHMEVTLKVAPKGPRSDDTVVSCDYRCTQIAQDAPPARNAPCPCGSGRKYKHCHSKAGA